MKKSDLEKGMVVETREGNTYVYLNEQFMNKNKRTCLDLDGFNDDLLRNIPNSPYDVVKIFTSSSSTLTDYFNELDLIWKRPVSLFKVGDIVTGDSSGEYMVTTEDAIMKVLSINDDYMKVEILSTTDDYGQCYIGNTYEVEQEYFSLTTLPVEKIKVGDHVLITGCESTPNVCKHYLKLNTVAEIVGINNEGNIYVVGVSEHNINRLVHQTIDAPDYELTDLPLTEVTPEIKEVTMADLEQKYGCKVKVVK